MLSLLDYGMKQIVILVLITLIKGKNTTMICYLSSETRLIC